MFRNVEMEPAQCTGSGSYAERLQNEMSDAWIAYMESGNPSTKTTPWKRYTAEDRCRLQFSEETHMNSVSDDLMTKLVAKHVPLFL